MIRDIFPKEEKKRKEMKKIASEVFDDETLMTLYKLANSGYFEILEFPISTGKEANVFRALGPKGEYLAIKIYRIETTDYRRIWKAIASDPRFPRIKRNLRAAVFAWTQREFKNLRIAEEAKIRAPRPIAFRKNVLIMSFIGRKGLPAPLLKDHPPKDPEKAYRQVVEQMKRLARKGFVHGDLSEYNILNFYQKMYFIDFSQGTIARNPNALEMLERDVRNVNRYFSKIGGTVKEGLFEELKEIILNFL